MPLPMSLWVTYTGEGLSPPPGLAWPGLSFYMKSNAS